MEHNEIQLQANPHYPGQIFFVEDENDALAFEGAEEDDDDDSLLSSDSDAEENDKMIDNDEKALIKKIEDLSRYLNDQDKRVPNSL